MSAREIVFAYDQIAGGLRAALAGIAVAKRRHELALAELRTREGEIANLIDALCERPPLPDGEEDAEEVRRIAVLLSPQPSAEAETPETEAQAA